MRDLSWVVLVLVLAVAAWLRTWGLARRPMHADEANQAVKAGELLGGGGYAFDPHDHHGPTLYYLTLPVAWLRGEHSLAALTETTVRLVPAAFGTLAVWLLAMLAGRGAPAGSGDREAPGGPRAHFLGAALLFAISPAAVYYARDYIQETLLLCFTLLAVASAVRWWATGRLSWAVAAGVAVGLMLATKETALLLLGTAGLAAAVARPGRPAGRRPGRDGAIAVATACVVAALFYSSFGRNPSGLGSALMAPWIGLRRATGATGHEKPWRYYLSLLTYVRSGGLVWEQGVFVALALIGSVSAWVGRDRWLRAATIYAAVLLLVLSAVRYKTPWNVVHVVPVLCLLAAGGVLAIGRLRTGRLVAAAWGFLVVASLLAQTHRAAFRFAADARNPWAYVQSAPDVTKYRPLVAAACARRPGEPVRIISEEYWPLPWYLRGLPRIGYWNTPPADCDGALVIVSADEADAVRARLHGRYRESYLGLRPGFVCIVFRPSDP